MPPRPEMFHHTRDFKAPTIWLRAGSFYMLSILGDITEEPICIDVTFPSVTFMHCGQTAEDIDTISFAYDSLIEQCRLCQILFVPHSRFHRQLNCVIISVYTKHGWTLGQSKCRLRFCRGSTGLYLKYTVDQWLAVGGCELWSNCRLYGKPRVVTSINKTSDVISDVTARGATGHAEFPANSSRAVIVNFQ